jgi:hypothetical protein
MIFFYNLFRFPFSQKAHRRSAKAVGLKSRSTNVGKLVAANVSHLVNIPKLAFANLIGLSN